MNAKQRAVIEFLRLEGQIGDQIHQHLRNVYRNEAYSCATVFNRVHEIDQGREDLEDAERSGRPSIFQIDSMLLELLRKFPFYNAHTLAEAVGVSHPTVMHHLNRLGFRYRILR
jgi:transposase